MPIVLPGSINSCLTKWGAESIMELILAVLAADVHLNVFQGYKSVYVARFRLFRFMSVSSLQIHERFIAFFFGSVHSVLNWYVVVLIGSRSFRARKQDVWYQNRFYSMVCVVWMIILMMAASIAGHPVSFHFGCKPSCVGTVISPQLPRIEQRPYDETFSSNREL